MKNAKSKLVSIIVPVYNAADTLEETLRSLLRQDDEITEIICVDDGSTDDSRRILKRYADFADNIRVVLNDKNQGTLMTRRDGVRTATGKYIMFVDSDDCLTDDTCTYLAKRMKDTGMDIINFGTEVFSETGVSEQVLAGVREVLRITPGVYENISLLDAVFVDKSISMTMWNKIYRAEIVKEAFAQAPDGRYLSGEDVFITFLCMYYTKRLMCEEHVCYRYRVGSGISTTTTITLKKMEDFCAVATLVEKLRSFLDSECCFETYQEAWESYRFMMMNDCIHKWLHYADASLKADAFEILNRTWGADNVFRHLVEHNHSLEQQAEIADMLVGVKSLQAIPRKVKTIGVFYYRVGNGGLERVATMLANMWIKMGYQVIFYMDYPVDQDAYMLDQNIKTILLPDSFSASPKARVHRYEKLSHRLKEDNVDVLVHHAWLSECLLWDVLAAKVNNIPVIEYTHSVFSCILHDGNAFYMRQFCQLPHIYHLIDVALVLSETNRTYWKNFVPTVRTVCNPCVIDFPKASIKRVPHSIVWVGRISPEKRVMDTIEILNKVRDQVPDATLTIVGKADEYWKSYYKSIVARVKELKLEEAVTFAGFHKDVAPFYMAAEYYLCTSEYEGFPIAVAESKIAGIPCVMYEMPYLLFAEQNKGLVSVRQNDVNAAANALIGMMRNPALWKQMSAEAKESAKVLDITAVENIWKDVFSSCEKEFPMWKPSHAPEDVMIHTLMDYLYTGLKNQTVSSSNAQYCIPSPVGPAPLPKMLQYKGPAKKLVTLTYYLRNGGPHAAWKAYKQSKANRKLEQERAM